MRTNTRRLLLTLMLTALVAGVTAPGPIRATPAETADFGISGFKAAPGLRCPCPLSTVVPIKRGLVHTFVLQGTLLQGASAVSAGSGITGTVLVKTLGEVTLTLNLRPDVALTERTVTVRAGTASLGTFRIRPISLGRVDSVSPTSVVGGRTTRVVVSGRDIRAGELSNPRFMRIVGRDNDRLTIEMTPPAELDASVPLQLMEQIESGARFSWKQLRVTVNATVATGGAGCQAQPPDEYHAPRLRSPSNNYRFAPLTGTQTQRQVRFLWDLPERTADPTQVLQYRRVGGRTVGWVSRELTGTSYTVNLTKGTYEWQMRNKNCGQSSKTVGPWTFVIQ